MSRITIEHTTVKIGMEEDPARACLRKPDASIVLAAKTVKEERAIAFFSPGNTGAAVAAGVIHIGLLPGIKRPVIAAPLPSIKGSVILLDVGACVDAPPRFFSDFARLGSIFAKKIFNIKNPSIGLLNMGSEPNKGPTSIKESFSILQKTCDNFIGNIEGMEIPSHKADVIVCDGFVGNIVLKLSEGFGSQMVKIVKHQMKKNSKYQRKKIDKTQTLAQGEIHRRLRRLTDSERHGGAPLLGLNGLAIIGHGRARSEAVFNGIRSAIRYNRLGLLEGMKECYSPQAATSKKKISKKNNKD